MGTCKLTMASTSLPSCLLLALSSLVAGVPSGYSPGDYKPDIGDGPPTDYGRPVKPNCHWEQKTTFQDRCEDYDEKTCWTQNEEQCSSYLVNTCTPVVNTGVDRRCFNVTELICELVESVHYRQVEENFHVQSCYTTKDPSIFFKLPIVKLLPHCEVCLTAVVFDLSFLIKGPGEPPVCSLVELLVFLYNLIGK